jgi:polyphosphate glucokinase
MPVQQRAFAPLSSNGVERFSLAVSVLVIDIGGTHLKVGLSSASGVRKVRSGRSLTAATMVEVVRKITDDWTYDALSIGYPGPILHNVPIREPANLGRGWVGFDFARAFNRPVKVVNDAGMQALGSYEGGCMLFLGLGTGLGSAMIVDGHLEPLELAHVPYKKGRTYEDMLGKRGLKRLGKKAWRRAVDDVIAILSAATNPDYVVVGGGNAKLLEQLPPGVRLGSNAKAFVGGFRLWTDASPVGAQSAQVAA